MIEAAQAAFLVACVDERGAAVRAVFVEHAEPALGVAEHHEVLAEQLDAQRLPVGLGDFLREAGRDPVAAHDRPHRRVAFDAAQEVVFFRRHASSREAFFCYEVSLMRTRGRVELGEP